MITELRSNHRRIGLRALAVAFVFGAALIAPALVPGAQQSAGAATLSVQALDNSNHGIIENLNFSVVVRGTAPSDDRYVLKAIIRPAGGVDCARTYFSDPGGSTQVISADVSGPIDEVDRVSVARPGRYLICAWLQETVGSTTALATNKAVIDVKQPTAELSLRATSVGSGQRSVLTVSGRSEIASDLYLNVRKDGARACAGSYGSDGDGMSLGPYDVEGDFSASPGSVLIDELPKGSYLVCGWVQDGPDDQQPMTLANATFTVGGGGSVDGGGDGAAKCTAAVDRAAGLKARTAMAKMKYKKAKGAAKRKAKKRYEKLRSQYRAAQASVTQLCE
jgi:hypothetical protein